MKKIPISLLLLLNILLFAQEPELTDYNFIIYDGSRAMGTMRQADRNFVSTAGIFVSVVDDLCGDAKIFNREISELWKYIPSTLISYTHESAHRSILTAQEICSIAYPIPEFYPPLGLKAYTVAYSSSLQTLHDENFPMYIRLCTAGLESDYMVIQRWNTLAAFNPELYSTAHWDMVWRTIGYVSYSSYRGLNCLNYENNSDVPFIDFSKKEGDDTGKMIHNLFNPETGFSDDEQAITDMSTDERDFAKRIALRSCLNFLNPQLYHSRNLMLGDCAIVKANIGYSLAPFGDFIDENLYLKFNNINVKAYARQYQNRNNWFPAFGISLYQYKPLDWLTLSFGGHFWRQPENLDFNTAAAQSGGAMDAELQFVFPLHDTRYMQSAGFSLGALYKTYGFMPEIEQHDSHFRLSAGLVLRF